MRFNSARPIKALTAREQDGLLDMLFSPDQSEVSSRSLSKEPFPPGWEVNYPAIQVSVEDFLTSPRKDLQSVEDFLTARQEELQAAAAPATSQGNQQANAPANQGRPWEGKETAALTFTFGETVGRYFRENMKFEPEQNHNPHGLKSMGNLIEEATYEWQEKTGRYTGGEGGSDYDYKQLSSRNLNSMQHAAAVRDWFYVSFGYEYNLIGTGVADQLTVDTLWDIILHVLNIKDKDKSKLKSRFKSEGWGGEKAALLNIVNNHYGCIIKEVRQLTKPVTLAGVKHGTVRP